MNETVQRKVSLHPRLRFRTIEEEGVIVHLESARVIVVNAVGLFLVEALNEPKFVSELIEETVQAFDVTHEEVGPDILAFLEQCELEQVISFSVE